MRLHNWVESILNTESKIRVLRLLIKYPEREFTEREIADEIKMSPNTVNLALKHLRNTNILVYRKIGKAQGYKSNTKSVLYAPVKALFKNESDVEKRLTETIKKYLSKSLSCIIFGSFAKGIESFTSDLDLLVIADKKDVIEPSVEKLRAEISEKFGTALSPIVLTAKDLRTQRDKEYIKRIVKEGILICGKRLEEIYGKRA
ncbi:MAG: nucleotidyltransferase domain-containing protein [Candidatus Thermoplasmatota archaeon]